ncbi:hypothetical protein PIB30_030117 [Stylosanthes scabra]|uniref:Uncharacterized protein n=1 Tax=Stylosanthes scabra TaxID=79078 RepID=A0ABU6Y8T0_9FABA|nr:hypothetical protein [Stylosanthes scabra]
MEMNYSNASVVFEAENDDDDSFYAEIRRQILLLTSEENEDVIENTSYKTDKHGGGNSNRSVYGVGGVASSLSSRSGCHGSFCCWESDTSGPLPPPAPPVWLVNLWKHGKGTGVFIPQVPCSKKQRSGRMNNGRRRIYRPVVNK